MIAGRMSSYLKTTMAAFIFSYPALAIALCLPCRPKNKQASKRNFSVITQNANSPAQAT